MLISPQYIIHTPTSCATFSNYYTHVLITYPEAVQPIFRTVPAVSTAHGMYVSALVEAGSHTSRLCINLVLQCNLSTTATERILITRPWHTQGDPCLTRIPYPYRMITSNLRTCYSISHHRMRTCSLCVLQALNKSLRVTRHDTSLAFT